MKTNAKDQVLEVVKFETELNANEELLAKINGALEVSASIKAIENLEDTKAAKKADEARKTLKELRVSIEKTRKDLIAPALDFQRQVNDKAKELISSIQPEEKRLEGIVKSFEDRKEEARLAEELRLQKEREEKLERLRLAGAKVGGGLIIFEHDGKELNRTIENALALDSETFEKMVATVKAGTLAREKREEAERERIAAELKELEELRKMKAELEAMKQKKAEEKAEKEAKLAELEAQTEDRLDEIDAAKERENFDGMDPELGSFEEEQIGGIFSPCSNHERDSLEALGQEIDETTARLYSAAKAALEYLIEEDNPESFSVRMELGEAIANFEESTEKALAQC